MRLSSTIFPKLLEGTAQDAAAILLAGGRQEVLPSFDIPAKLRVRLHLTQRSYSSPNVLAVLPGADPNLRNQYIVIAAIKSLDVGDKFVIDARFKRSLFNMVHLHLHVFH